MITDVVFDTPIGGEYKRNNRSTRQKSLRCFPSCGIKGHVPGGFCGLPLKVTIEVTKESSDLDFDARNYLFIAEIRPVSQPRISAATSISEADLLRQIRTKEKSETYGELFQADSNIHVEPLSGETWQVELTFNSHHCSWDYAWKSNRWSGPQEQHVVDIIVLKTASASEYRVVSSKPSSPFVVSSSHKKPQKTNQVKGEGEEDEAICLPTKSKSASRTVVGAVDEDDDDDERIQFTNTKMNYNHTVRPPTRELRCSDDKTEFIFTPCQPQGVAEETAAATLMMLMSGTSTKKPAATASSDAAAAPTSRKEKKPTSPEKRPPAKRSRTGDVPVPQQLMDLRMSYPYPYLYPVGPGGGPVSSAGEGFPPLWGAYPYPVGTNFAPPLPFPYPYLLSQPPDSHYMYHIPEPLRNHYLPPGYNGALSSHSESEEEAEVEEGNDREGRPVQEVAAAVVGDDSDGSPTSSARHIPIAIAQPVAAAVSAGPAGERRTAKSAKRAPIPSSNGPNGSRDVLHTAWDGVIRAAPTVSHVPSLRTTGSENRATSSSDHPKVNARSSLKEETKV